MMLYYLFGINVITFILYVLDKWLAIKRKKRISEYHLLTLSVFGGCFLGFFGMYLVHHKTRKCKFIITNILEIIIWTYIVIQLN